MRIPTYESHQTKLNSASFTNFQIHTPSPHTSHLADKGCVGLQFCARAVRVLPGTSQLQSATSGQTRVRFSAGRQLLGIRNHRLSTTLTSPHRYHTRYRVYGTTGTAVPYVAVPHIPCCREVLPGRTASEGISYLVLCNPNLPSPRARPPEVSRLCQAPRSYRYWYIARMGRIEAETCSVCKEKASKYRCPGCAAPYCSLACNKAHKAGGGADDPRPPCTGKRVVAPDSQKRADGQSLRKRPRGGGDDAEATTEEPATTACVRKGRDQWRGGREDREEEEWQMSADQRDRISGCSWLKVALRDPKLQGLLVSPVLLCFLCLFLRQ